MQHHATWWPNECNMLDSTMLDDVASTCWIRLARPLHLFWMLYRQASRHTKHMTPHTYTSFRPRLHDSWPPSCLEIVIYAKMHILVRDVTGRHYNARNSDVSLPRPPRGKRKRRLNFRLSSSEMP